MRNTEFISGLAQHIIQKYKLKQEELTIVFPNKRAAFYLRSKFKEIYREDIWLPQMLSIQEAMTQWSGISLIDTVDVLFELVAIDSEIYGNKNNINIFGSMAVQMAKDFDEIDQYQVDADHLFSFVFQDKQIGAWHFDKDITEKEKQYLKFFKELKSYYIKLREHLKSQGKGYYGMITRYLAELDETELLERTSHRSIIFAGFNALTPSEQQIIRKLFRSGHAEVIWDFDRYYVEDPQNEAGLFARRYIEKNEPWKPVSFSDRLLNEEKQIHLVKVNGNTIQAKALQSLLQAKVKDDAVVILADEKLMIPVLNAIPDDPKYASLKVSMGYPLQLTSMNSFVREFFKLRRKGHKVKDKGWYLWPLLRLMDLELTKVIFSPQEIKQLDRYKSYVKERSIFIYHEEDFNSCCQSDDLRTFMKLLTDDARTDECESKKFLDLLAALLAFIANKIQVADKASSTLFLLNQVSEVGQVVNRLNGILERYPRYANSLEELEVLYRLVSTNTSIKLNSSSTEGVQLMGLLEARNLDFDTFYMVGVNEGVLPTEKSSSSFIPYYIRKEVQLPDYQEKQAVYAYHFYRQLQGAKKIYFIYNVNSADAGGEPSRFLLQLKYELARRNPKIELIEECFSNRTEKATSPAMLVAHKTDEVMEKLLEKIHTDDPKRALAPTSLAAYIQCPLHFFLKYLMRIEDNALEEETQSNVIGTVVHDTLEQLYKDYCHVLIDKEVFSTVIKPSLKGHLQRMITKRFSQGLPDVGYNYLDKLAIDKVLENYLGYEEAEISKHTLEVLDVEHTFHATVTVNGVECAVAGKADRVDRYDGLVRIIDYKTGFINERDVKVPAVIDSVRDIPEKAMQLLIYKYLYLKEHPEVHPDTVTAALFGLKNHQVRFQLKVEHQGLNDNFMVAMEALLGEVLASMLDQDTPFTQPSDTKIKPCHFCDFKRICINTATGALLANDR